MPQDEKTPPPPENPCGGCGINPAKTDHPCPYQSELHENDEDYCQCCPDCEHDCLMNI